jgi:nucleoside-diphosphate-sugar epimerase
MRILVTGATSGLGRNAVEWLLDAGHQVVAVGRNHAIGEQLRAQGAIFHLVDLDYASDSECLSMMQGCDAVWHCAAKSSPWGARAAFITSNVTVTDRLANAAGQMGIPRFVHISSPAIYFDFQHRLAIEEQFHARHFANHYAYSKFLAEACIRQRQQQFPASRFTILRPRGLFGAHDRVIVPRIMQRIRQGQGVLHLPRAGAALLDLTFTLNVVHAMWLATTQPVLPPAATYNISNHQPTALNVMLQQLFADHLGIHIVIKPVSYPLLYGAAYIMESMARLHRHEPPLTRYSVGVVNFDMTLSQTRAAQELQYQPSYSLEQGIALTAQFFKQHKGVLHG